MAEVVFRRAAERDLEEIVAHIAIDDMEAASRFRDRIVARIKVLQTLPNSAQPRPEFGADTRTIPIGSYIAFVRVRGSKVAMLRILHGARDLPRIMKPRP